MDRLWDLVVGQLRAFNDLIGPENNLGVCLPGISHSCLLPSVVEDFNAQVIILQGDLEDGRPARAVFDSSSFPLVLVAIPKPQDQPKRAMGFHSMR